MQYILLQNPEYFHQSEILIYFSKYFNKALPNYIHSREENRISFNKILCLMTRYHIFQNMFTQIKHLGHNTKVCNKVELINFYHSI